MLTSVFLHQKSVISRNTDIDCILIIIANSFFQSIKVILINMIAALMMSTKSVSLSVLKTKIFWNSDYDLKNFVQDVTNKILLHDSIYIADVAMWPKFDNSNIYMREVIITSIL